MVSYCAWNKHNNLSSRALVWHTYHHDVFVYIVDISFLNILKDRYIAVHKEEKIQVSLSSWLSIKLSEKGDIFAVCSLWNLSFSITHQTLQACERRIRAWDAKQSRRLLLPSRLHHQIEWGTLKCFLCILRYLNLSFLNRNLLFISYFYDVMAHWSLFCQKKISVKSHYLQ